MSESVTLCLLGDVMTGRGIDQILPFPSPPDIYEPYVTDAGEYVDLAERAHGPIPREAGFDYVWGDAVETFGPESLACHLSLCLRGRMLPWTPPWSRSCHESSS